jgi:hypothetical protein
VGSSTAGQSLLIALSLIRSGLDRAIRVWKIISSLAVENIFPGVRESPGWPYVMSLQGHANDVLVAKMDSNVHYQGWTAKDR